MSNTGLKQPVEILIVEKRCVYINNHRVAGAKPYVSEKLPTLALRTTLGEILAAFPDWEIEAAMAERKAALEDLMKMKAYR